MKLLIILNGNPYDGSVYYPTEGQSLLPGKIYGPGSLLIDDPTRVSRG